MAQVTSALQPHCTTQVGVILSLHPSCRGWMQVHGCRSIFISSSRLAPLVPHFQLVLTASVYAATGDLSRASSLLTRALAIKRTALGADAIELVDSLRQLAEVNIKQVSWCNCACAQLLCSCRCMWYSVTGQHGGCSETVQAGHRRGAAVARAPRVQHEGRCVVQNDLHQPTLSLHSRAALWQAPRGPADRNGEGS